MQCPKCLRKDFEIDLPCPQCGFQLDAHSRHEMGHLQWLLGQLDGWEAFDINAATIAQLKKIYTARLKGKQVTLGLRLPSFTADKPEEMEKAWVELTHLETLFEKVEEWRSAGYLKTESEGPVDPVKTQRDHADELREQLEDTQRPQLPQNDQSRLKTVSFLMDQIDLLASRGWFKSKKDIEKAVAPIMAIMVDIMSTHAAEDL